MWPSGLVPGVSTFLAKQDASRPCPMFRASVPLADGCAFAVWWPVQGQQLACGFVCVRTQNGINGHCGWQYLKPTSLGIYHLPTLHSDIQSSLPNHSYSLLPPHHLQNPDEKGHSCQLIFRKSQNFRVSSSIKSIIATYGWFQTLGTPNHWLSH
jgi:hypothetical protein